MMPDLESAYIPHQSTMHSVDIRLLADSKPLGSDKASNSSSSLADDKCPTNCIDSIANEIR